MRIVVLHTINFEPPSPGDLPLAIAHEVDNADVTICVYQNAAGESQAEVVKPAAPDDHVEVFDVF